MVTGAVIALAVVFPHQLPVAVLHDGGLEGNPRRMQPMGQQVRLDLPAGCLEVGRFGGHADEDITRHRLAMDAAQAELTFVEAGSHLARGAQAAVELVGPLVIGTHEPGGDPVRLVANTRAAMPTTVYEGMDGAVPIARQQNGKIADLHCQVAAGVRELRGMRGKQPFLVENQLQLEGMDSRVAVELARQTVRGVSILQATQYTGGGDQLVDPPGSRSMHHRPVESPVK
jgi:hypothetical protein